MPRLAQKAQLTPIISIGNISRPFRCKAVSFVEASQSLLLPKEKLSALVTEDSYS